MSPTILYLFGNLPALPSLAELMAWAPNAEVTIRRKGRTHLLIQWPDQRIEIDELALQELDDSLQASALEGREGRPPSVILQATMHPGPAQYTLPVADLIESMSMAIDAYGIESVPPALPDRGATRSDTVTPRAQDRAQAVEPGPPRNSWEIATRLLALAAVVARANIERLERGPGLDLIAKLLRWVLANNVLDKLELPEHDLVMAPFGELSEAAVIDASWRAEGVGILAWALELMEAAPHDEVVDLGPLFADLQYGIDARSPLLLEAPSRRNDDELEWMRRRLHGIHWRIQRLHHNPEPVNFLQFAQGGGDGFDTAGISLVDQDLALGGVAITEADPSRVSSSLSIALERHRAINWICGHPGNYSQVAVST